MRFSSKPQPFITLLERGMKGWVMDGIAREAPKSIHLSNRTFYLPTRVFHYLPYNPAYWKFLVDSNTTFVFLHHRSFLRYKSHVNLDRTRVFITHIDENQKISKNDLDSLARVQKVIFQNSNLFNWGTSMGLEPQKCLIAHGAVSKDEFYPLGKMPKSQYVLIAGECKPRKNPELINALIQSRTDLNFIIHGNGWASFFKNSIPSNLKLLDFNRKSQPKLVREASALLSLSKNEGGPFPILEALASGTPVLATNTGFANELINETCGKVINEHSKLTEISSALSLVIQLKQLTKNVNCLSSGHSWPNFAEKLYIL